MPTKISFIYDNPTDPAAFEAGLPALLEQKKRIPGLTRLDSSKVWAKEDGSETPLFRIVNLYFDDYASASAAVATEQAGEMFPGAFSLATGGVRIAFADVEVDETF
ncbi:MAG: EthD family reductase [Pseudolysinimonas sp.]